MAAQTDTADVRETTTRTELPAQEPGGLGANERGRLLLAARRDRRRYPEYARRQLTRWIQDDRPDPGRIATVAALLAQAPGHTRDELVPSIPTALTDMLARAAAVKART